MAEPAVSLFLLFLREIYSEEHLLPRRNPGVSAAQRTKEQQISTVGLAPHSPVCVFGRTPAREAEGSTRSKSRQTGMSRIIPYLSAFSKTINANMANTLIEIGVFRRSMRIQPPRKGASQREKGGLIYIIIRILTSLSNCDMKLPVHNHGYTSMGNEIWLFIRALGSQWFIYMSGCPAVPLTIVAFMVESQTARIGLVITAILCFLLSAFFVWRQEFYKWKTENQRVVCLKERLTPKISVIYDDNDINCSDLCLCFR